MATMLDQLDQLKQQALTELEGIIDAQAAEFFRVKYLGKKGELTSLLKNMDSVSDEDRPKVGQLGNEIKTLLTQEVKKRLGAKSKKNKGPQIDMTLPGTHLSPGRQHPVTTVMQECIQVFRTMGFSIETGPDIETDFYNFEALNIPGDHPARDMHDTFYLTDHTLLRTHTSPVQIRTMENTAPPLRMIAPGKVYRRDSDVTHLPMFHQIEGLLVDKNISFSDLKGVLSMFLQAVFGEGTGVRFRPSYFPFTEPSAEIDIFCVTCKGKGCRICSHTGWLEIAGAGMVDPEVFKAVDYNTDEWTGFAFGLGIERIAMLKLGITDIRLFYENDLRFLEQF